MILTRDSLCPLCASRMTDFHEWYGDGEHSRCDILQNVCANYDCRLPVKLWEKLGLKLAWARRKQQEHKK